MKPALPPADFRRPSLSLGTKLRACLILLGFDPDAEIDWHHSPSLAQRPWDEAMRDFVPGFADPGHLVPLARATHQERTAKLDAPANAKVRRVAKKQAAHVARMEGEEPVRKKFKRTWPKGRIASRPFEKRRKPLAVDPGAAS